MGSHKWASEQTADSLTLAHTYGPPSFFITMMCNPNWPKIKSCLHPGQHAYDAPVVVTHAFKIHLQRLTHILKTKMGSLMYMTTSTQQPSSCWQDPKVYDTQMQSSHKRDKSVPEGKQMYLWLPSPHHCIHPY